MPRKPNPAARARNAANAIQELNHLTLSQQLPAPHISEVTQSLCALLDRLPQTLEQLARQVQQRADDGQIRMDDHTDPEQSAAAVQQALQDTLQHLAAASTTLHSAATPLFHMAAR